MDNTKARYTSSFNQSFMYTRLKSASSKNPSSDLLVLVTENHALGVANQVFLAEGVVNETLVCTLKQSIDIDNTTHLVIDLK